MSPKGDSIKQTALKPLLSPKVERKKPVILVKKSAPRLIRNRDLSPQTITLSNTGTNEFSKFSRNQSKNKVKTYVSELQTTIIHKYY